MNIKEIRTFTALFTILFDKQHHQRKQKRLSEKNKKTTKC
jgi:hypothetical protein